VKVVRRVEANPAKDMVERFLEVLELIVQSDSRRPSGAKQIDAIQDRTFAEAYHTSPWNPCTRRCPPETVIRELHGIDLRGVAESKADQRAAPAEDYTEDRKAQRALLGRVEMFRKVGNREQGQQIATPPG
jgi:hypothetical protein